MNPTAIFQVPRFLNAAQQNIPPAPTNDTIKPGGFASSILSGLSDQLHSPLFKTGGLLLGALAINKTFSVIRKKVTKSPSIKESTKLKINAGLVGTEYAFDAGALLYVLDSWNVLNVGSWLTSNSSTIAKVGTLALGGYLLYRQLSLKYKTTSDDENLTEPNRKAIKFAVKMGQAAILGGATFLGLQAMGVEVNGLIAGLGLFSLAIKETIQSLLAFAWYKFDKPFDFGDNVVLDKRSGVVKKVSALFIKLETFDAHGNKVLVTVPTSAIFSQFATERERDQNFIDQIQVGDCLTIPNKTGIVKAVNEQVAILETIDANGLPAREPIDLNDLNPLTCTNYKRGFPPLPFGLKFGDRFELGGKKYEVSIRHDMSFLVVIPLDGKEEKGESVDMSKLKYLPIKDLMVGGIQRLV